MRFALVCETPQKRMACLSAIVKKVEKLKFFIVQAVCQHDITLLGEKRDGVFRLMRMLEKWRICLHPTTKTLFSEFGIATYICLFGKCDGHGASVH